MNKIQIKEVLIQARNLLSKDIQDTNEIVSHLAQLTQFSATLAHAKACAMVEKNKAQVEVLSNIDEKKLKILSAKLQSEYIDGLITDECKIYEFARSLERDYQCAIDAYRTIISFRKTELEKLQD